MPHVIVKLWPGKTEQQKTRLAEAITKDVMGILHYSEESVFRSDGGDQTERVGREGLQS
jgi:Tautomerase enzyme